MRRALAAVLVLAGCDSAPEPPSPQTPRAQESVELPQDQAAFVALAQQTGTPEGAAKFCDDVAKRDRFSGWQVTVRSADVHTGNHSVAISFDPGGDVKLEQVVQAGNPLHETVNSLRIGDRVRISGRFTHGNAECAYTMDSFGIALTEVR